MEHHQIKMTAIVLSIFALQYNRVLSFGLNVHNPKTTIVPFRTRQIRITCLHSTGLPGGDSDREDDASSDDGASLAADFFKALQNRNIELTEDDLLDDEDDNDEEDVDSTNDSDSDLDKDEDTEEINIPDDAVKSFADFDETADDVTITNEEVYSALKERVLESAGSFIDLVGTADEGDDETDDDEDAKDKKIYVTPETVPDSSLTAGEVVTTILDALRNNDTPTNNRGIEVLFGYSSAGSIISQAVEDEGMTPSEYGDFLKEDDEYKVLFDHSEVIIDKGDYSFNKKKAFFTARLRTGDGPQDFTGVNFILSTSGDEEDDCWLVDSMLIRPEGMRRRRRR